METIQAHLRHASEEGGQAARPAVDNYGGSCLPLLGVAKGGLACPMEKSPVDGGVPAAMLPSLTAGRSAGHRGVRPLSC